MAYRSSGTAVGAITLANVTKEFTTPDGKSGGILLQGDKDNYRGILVALQGVANVPVSVAEKEREFVPVSIKSTVAKEPTEEKKAEEKK